MIKKQIAVGTCGFSKAKADYARLLCCVEVQQTFYQPPQVATLERWRRAVPTDFAFAVKAWQLITHEATSPTYRRLKTALSEAGKSEAGFFKPTTLVGEAWQVTLACARALNARTVLFQCPASFKPTRENIANLSRFFSEIDRQGLQLGWEPRGNWESGVIQSICADLDLWHVVDPFVNRTVTPDRCYFRLHGRTGWRYQYEDHELRDLVELLPPESPSYVFFNNIHMMEDALRFRKILAESRVD